MSKHTAHIEISAEKAQEIFDAKVDRLSQAFGTCGNCDLGIDECPCTVQQLEDIVKTFDDRRKNMKRNLIDFSVKTESDKIVQKQMFERLNELTSGLIKAQKNLYKDIKYHNDYKELKYDKLETENHILEMHFRDWQDKRWDLEHQKKILLDENIDMSMKIIDLETRLKSMAEEHKRQIKCLLESKVFPDEIAAHFDAIPSAAGVGPGPGPGGAGAGAGIGSLPSSPPRPRSNRFSSLVMSPRHIDFDDLDHRDARILPGLREDEYVQALEAAFDESNKIDDDVDSIHGGRKRSRK